MTENFGPRVETQVFATGTRTTRRPATPLALAFALLERVDLEQQVQALTEARAQLAVENANLRIGLAAMDRKLVAAEQRVDELEQRYPTERATRNMRAVALIDSGECEDKIVIDDPAAWDGVDTTEVPR